MSVPGASGGTSGGAPSTRGHSPSGTLSSTRGVRSEEGEMMFSSDFLHCNLQRRLLSSRNHPSLSQMSNYRERERRRRERE